MARYDILERLVQAQNSSFGYLIHLFRKMQYWWWLNYNIFNIQLAKSHLIKSRWWYLYLDDNKITGIGTRYLACGLLKVKDNMANLKLLTLSNRTVIKIETISVTWEANGYQK